MKKLLFTAACVLTLSGAALAQAGSGDLDNRVATVTRDMSVKLGLNESDYIRLKNMNRENLVKADEITNTYKNDVAMRNQKLQELQTSYDSQLRTFLSSKQLEAYASYKTNNGNFTALDGDKK